MSARCPRYADRGQRRERFLNESRLSRALAAVAPLAATMNAVTTTLIEW